MPLLWHQIAEELVQNTNMIATPGKGILAADESTGTIGKRFDKIPNTEENRAYYRELLFSTTGLAQFVSGASLDEETLYQKTVDGTRLMVDLLRDNSIIPGIKVGQGLAGLAEGKRGRGGTPTGPLLVCDCLQSRRGA